MEFLKSVGFTLTRNTVEFGRRLSEEYDCKGSLKYVFRSNEKTSVRKNKYFFERTTLEDRVLTRCKSGFSKILNFAPKSCKFLDFAKSSHFGAKVRIFENPD